MSNLIPTLPARTPAEHQAAVQHIFDTEHEFQVFLISQTESDRVGEFLSCASLPEGELIGLLPSGQFPDYGFTSLGRVWSRPRPTFDRNGKCNGHAGNRFLAPNHSTQGYFLVSLCDVNGPHKLLIPRLVAQTHLANPQHFPEINHRDSNRANNRTANLEWGTHRYNKLYSILHRSRLTPYGVYEESHDPQRNHNWRQPFHAQTILNGKLKTIGQYPTALEAAQAYDAFVIQYGIPTWLNFP